MERCLRAEGEAEKLAEALRFYADDRRYNWAGYGNGCPAAIHIDAGGTAEDALASYRAAKKKTG